MKDHKCAKPIQMKVGKAVKTGPKGDKPKK